MIGDESGLFIAGMGDIQLRLSDGFMRFIYNVFYVLFMVRNLVSVRYVFREWNVRVEFDGIFCTIMDNRNE